MSEAIREEIERHCESIRQSNDETNVDVPGFAEAMLQHCTAPPSAWEVAVAATFYEAGYLKGAEFGAVAGALRALGEVKIAPPPAGEVAPAVVPGEVKIAPPPAGEVAPAVVPVGEVFNERVAPPRPPPGSAAAALPHLRIIVFPCCKTRRCWVSQRLPNFCPECGKAVYPQLSDPAGGHFLADDEHAITVY